jgi:hypothetical protein
MFWLLFALFLFVMGGLQSAARSSHLWIALAQRRKGEDPATAISMLEREIKRPQLDLQVDLEHLAAIGRRNDRHMTLLRRYPRPT